MTYDLKKIFTFFVVCGLVFAGGGGNPPPGGEDFNYADPSNEQCESKTNGIERFSCNVMQSLLRLGPVLAVAALVIAGMIYIYASVLVTADQRGRYHSLATNLAIGGILLAVLVGGAGLIAQAGKGFLVA